MLHGIEDSGSESFIRFMLSGETIDKQDRPRQAFVNPLQNAVPDEYKLFILHNYDSLLDISPIIMVATNISVFAVPHPTFALKSSVHMTHRVSDGDVRSACSNMFL